MTQVGTIKLVPALGPCQHPITPEEQRVYVLGADNPFEMFQRYTEVIIGKYRPNVCAQEAQNARDKEFDDGDGANLD